MKLPLAREYKQITLLWIFWFLIINLFAVIAISRFNLLPDTAYGWIAKGTEQVTRQYDFSILHRFWDGSWYVSIVQHGYVYNGAGKLSNVVFFPLYPFVVWLLHTILPVRDITAGWIVSALASLAAAVLLVRHTKLHHPKLDAILPSVFLLVFPTAFFLQVMYTESLFLALTIAFFTALLSRKYPLATLLGVLAALTRVTGSLLIIPAIIEWWIAYRQHKSRGRDLILLSLIPFATIGFFAYHWIAFGDPLLFFHVEAVWGRAFSLRSGNFVFNTPPAIVNQLFDASMALFGIIMSFLAAKRLRLSYGLYMLATIAVALSTGTLMSIGRYVLVLFPFALVLTTTSRTTQMIYTFCALLLCGMVTTLFATNAWAG